MAADDRGYHLISRACEAIGGRDPGVVGLSATELPFMVMHIAYPISARRLSIGLHHPAVRDPCLATKKKSKKYIGNIKRSYACDPAKRDFERTRIELTVLDF